MAPVSSFTTLPLVLLVASTLSTLALADPVHVPIARRKTARVLDLNEEAFRLRQRYGKTNATSLPVKSSGTGRRAALAGLPIGDQDNDSSYFATFPQQFNVILDTGSSDLWLAGDNCQRCSPSTPLFKTSSSSTFKTIGTSTTQINYGSGSVAGVTSSDTVQMGGFKIDGQTLLNANNLKTGLLDGDVSGILGLAFQGIAETKAVPFWQALITDKQLTSPEFGFYLRRAPATNRVQDIPGGVFTLGGTNGTLFSGDIDFVNMPATGAGTFWLLSMTALTLNGQNVAISTGNNALSAIDTGTTLIGGPTADVQAFWAAVPNSAPSPSGPGYFNFPCNQQLSVSMSFGGKSWPISSQDMNIGTEQNDNTRCVGAIFDLEAGTSITASDGNPGWVVGDTFLKNVYSVFRSDPPSVGFAELSTNAGGTGTPNAASAPSTTSTTSPGQNDSSDKKSAATTTTTSTFVSAFAVLISAVLFNLL
ncbi:hypothetical protein D9619_011734 [Psilocybe cf. subviscida]|uniref:Peptidase A1 domain-containing protein n=1 Tax=Psilocybe cf. subviscida TaxID=2480587 RepID=A0A8H5BSX4_9AGAR|nr:hypothetical protein D9619_011734 [Psilocybe cf. subviscida]